MKLSRPAWNNVIIFSILAFILVINLTNNKVSIEADSISNNKQSTLFNANATIITLQFHPTIIIERVGKDWRCNPNILNAQALEQMMRSWKKSEGETVDEKPKLDEKMALVVKVELAQEAEVQELHLFATDTELFILNKTTQVLRSFPLAIFSQLVPNEVFSV